MMNTSTKHLCGFINPLGNAPCFITPVFCDENKIYTQLVDVDDQVIDFCTIEQPPSIYFKRYEHSRCISVGDKAIFGFQFGPKEIVLEERLKLTDQLFNRYAELVDRPFLLFEIAQFLGNEQLKINALSSATASLATINPRIARNWNITEHEKSKGIEKQHGNIQEQAKKKVEEEKQENSDFLSYRVFITTNPKQIIGAMVAEYALKRNSQHSDKFHVQIIQTTDYSFLPAREGQMYLRDGVKRPWLNNDLRSFTPLRFMPPELMNYHGRAVVIDPNVFAVTDIWDLLTRDMQGKAIMCRMQANNRKGLLNRCKASSVMLLDCTKLTHWKVEQQFDEMFDFDRDYLRWLCLRYEDSDTIGFFENEWNVFDKLTIHRTQPWKVSLPIYWRPAKRFRLFPPLDWLMRARRRLFGDCGLLGNYKSHPDPNQERFFFGLLRECVDKGIITEEIIRDEMEQDHVRHDALDVLRRTEPLVS